MRLVSLLALLVCAAGALAALSPVVIIPGDGGSQLEGRAVNKPSKPHFFCSSSFAWTRMWVAVTEFAPGVIDCWADNVRLVFDAATGAVVNSPGLEFRVPAFGNTSAIEVLDPSLPSQTSYFDKMVARLVAIGLQRGVSVRGAPYDFRHSPRSAAYVSDIVRLIEETYAINSNMPVVLVSHSMGCKVALELLAAQSAEWKARYIRAWVPVSPALGGSNSVLRLFAAGDAEGVPAVSPLSIRSEQRSFESNFWLIPQSELWPGQVLVTTPQRTYTLDDLQQFFADIQYPEGWTWYNLVVANLTNSYRLPLPAPGVPVFCFVGTGVPTAESFVWNASTGAFPDSQPAAVNGDGDGTVNARALNLCAESSWPSVKLFRIANGDHRGLVADAQVIDLIASLVQS